MNMNSTALSVLRYCENSPIAFLRNVPTSLVVYDERALYKCKYGCRNYNRKHSCPPESIKIRKIINENYDRWVLLYATTEKIPKNYSNYRKKLENYVREYEIQRISRDLNNIFNDQKVAHYTLSGGSCHRCRSCSKMRGNKCIRPSIMQTSMEAVGIDCQRTMHKAGFDFQMPNIDSINRCGCIFHNVDSLRDLEYCCKQSNQRFVNPTLANTKKQCKELILSFPELYESVSIVSVSKLPIKKRLCNNCSNRGKNYACPPYSGIIALNLWRHAIIWKWRENESKTYSYNRALLRFHKKIFSLGYYLSQSLRDGPCDECTPCISNDGIPSACPNRRLLAPSIQSQNIDIEEFGSGIFGIELI